MAITDSVESEAADYSDLALTLNSADPLTGSLRIAPNLEATIEGVFRAL